MTAANNSGSPFWRFSLRFYREPAVADACIALQEEAGIDVNLLLFLLWHATRARVLSKKEVEELETAIAPWRDATVIPLRGVRRGAVPHQDQGGRARGRAPAAGGDVRAGAGAAFWRGRLAGGGGTHQYRRLPDDVSEAIFSACSRNPACGVQAPRAQGIAMPRDRFVMRELDPRFHQKNQLSCRRWIAGSSPVMSSDWIQHRE